MYTYPPGIRHVCKSSTSIHIHYISQVLYSTCASGKNPSRGYATLNRSMFRDFRWFSIFFSPLLVGEKQSLLWI